MYEDKLILYRNTLTLAMMDSSKNCLNNNNVNQLRASLLKQGFSKRRLRRVYKLAKKSAVHNINFLN